MIEQWKYGIWHEASASTGGHGWCHCIEGDGTRIDLTWDTRDEAEYMARLRFGPGFEVRVYEPVAPATKRSPAPSPQVDTIEQRVYAFFTAPRPGNCACNVPRDQCQYHKPRDYY